MASNDDEEVGYGRPPKHSRFKPGQSGNPAGRRTGERNVATALAAELNATVVIRENGRERKISKAEAMAKALVLKALKGDAKAFSQIMALLPSQFQMGREAQSDADISAAECTALERFITRTFNQRAGASVAESAQLETDPNLKEEGHE